jgi:hypothetical protein
MNIKRNGSTILLRLALIVITLGAFVFWFIAFPELWRNVSLEGELFTKPVRTILLGMYLSAIPFLLGLWNAWNILRYIDTGNAFSEHSVRALKYIKQCALVIALLFVATLPFFVRIGEADDAPGVIVIGMSFVAAPILVAVFAALLQKLLRSTIEMKKENDLTV